MTVSVIIPCFRDSATLARAIDSVLAQTHRETEVIVVNDCSPESERIEAVLQAFPQVRYLRNKQNLGLAATRNAGIRAAEGEYVALLDADDEYLPTKIAAQLAAIAPDLAVTCGVMNVLPDGSRIPNRLTLLGERLVDRASQIHFRNTLNGAGLFIKRRLLIENGLFDESLRSCEDFDLWLRLLGNGIRIKDIGQPLYAYHANPAGLSKDLRNISKWETEVIRRYALRRGRAWMGSQEYAAVSSAWLLRQLLRAEVADDPVLREQIVVNICLLDRFPVYAAMLRVLARSRLMGVPAAFYARQRQAAKQRGS